MAGALKSVVERYWKAVDDRNWAGFESLLQEDIVYEIPQTKERVRGRARLREFNATYPGDWSIELVSVVADDNRAVSHILFRLADEEQSAITFFEFKDDLISNVTEFWPESYEPPVRVVDFIERY